MRKSKLYQANRVLSFSRLLLLFIGWMGIKGMIDVLLKE